MPAPQYIQAQKFKLNGSGITSTDTSITLTNMTLPDGTTKIVTADLGDTTFMTLEPGTSKEELISFTGITQNVGGTATLTGVTRGLRFVYPHDEVSANKMSHAGGTIAILTNASALYQKIIDYINAASVAGAVDASTTVKGIVEEATEAEVIAGTATGGTGARLFVNPSNLLTGIVSATTSPIVRTYLTAASPATWTKPAGLKYVVVEVQAGGGGGGGLAGPSSGNESGGGGGGSGGYSKKLIVAESLGATETVTIGIAGTGGSSGNGGTGGDSSFGSHATTTGGAGGTGTNSGSSFSGNGGAGGSASSGDLNINGITGGGAHVNDNNLISGSGASSILGIGAFGVRNTSGGGAGVGYGAGGSGGATIYNDGAVNGGAGSAGIVIITEYYI